MSSVSKRRWKVSAGIGAVLIAVGLVTFFKAMPTSQNNDVVVIDDQAVSSKEFQMILEEQKAGVIHYFYNQDGVTINGDQWTRPIKGQIPLNVAKKRALKTLIRIKVQQIVMLKEGITNNISYKSFQEQLVKENLKRKGEVQSGEPVYGPEAYNAQDYYQYLFSNHVIALKQKLASTEWNLKNNQQEKVDARYNALVNNMVGKAVVKRNQQVYNKMEMP